MFPVGQTPDPGGSCLSITQCPDVASPEGCLGLAELLSQVRVSGLVLFQG